MDRDMGFKIILHFSLFLGLPFILPIILYFMAEGQEQGRLRSLCIQALLFQGMMGFLMALFFFLSFISIEIGLLPFGILIIVCILTPIVGIIYAIQDRHFSYPIVGFLVPPEL